MRIIYNGVDLGVLELIRFDSEGVLDPAGVDYLYTRHTIVVRAIVNGQADVQNIKTPAGSNIKFRNGPTISYRFGDSQNGTPVKDQQDVPPGSSPRNLDYPPFNVRGLLPSPMDARVGVAGHRGTTSVGPELDAPNTEDIRLREIISIPTTTNLTMAAIRHRLTTPQGKLYVFSGGWDDVGPSQILLESPGDDKLRCDCNNGPKPRILSIPQAYGDATTLMVDFAIETYLTEAEGNGVFNSTILLSNRFSQTQVTDEDGYTTVATTGTAIMRTDKAYLIPESPDTKRPLLFLPIPSGFVREGITVTGLPDVTGVRYSFSDRQVPVNFTAGTYARASRISAIHRQAIVTGDVLEGALQAYERVLGIAVQKNFANPNLVPGLTHPTNNTLNINGFFGNATGGQNPRSYTGGQPHPLSFPAGSGQKSLPPGP